MLYTLPCRPYQRAAGTAFDDGEYGPHGAADHDRAKRIRTGSQCTANHCTGVAENDSKLIEATEWLDNELRITEKYTSDFSEDVRKLKEAHSKIDEKIRDVWKQIKTIEEKFISSKALVSKREKVNYAKARIALYAEMSSSGIFETVDGDIEELKEKIARLEEKIKGFDVDKKMSKAESF